jgi:hypothetical protein
MTSAAVFAGPNPVSIGTCDIGVMSSKLIKIDETFLVVRTT